MEQLSRDIISRLIPSHFSYRSEQLNFFIVWSSNVKQWQSIAHCHSVHDSIAPDSSHHIIPLTPPVMNTQTHKRSKYMPNTVMFPCALFLPPILFQVRQGSGLQDYQPLTGLEEGVRRHFYPKSDHMRRISEDKVTC